MDHHKQRHPRVRKRVAVHFGPTSDVRSLGFTTNASFRGLGISATSIYPAGTALHFRMKLPGDRICSATGVVAWSMRGMVALQVPGTMGIRISSADESFFQLLADNTSEEQNRAASGPTQTRATAAFGTSPAPRTTAVPSSAAPGRAASAPRSPTAPTLSGRPSNPKPPASYAAPPPPKMPFRFPRLDEHIEMKFGRLAGESTAAPSARVVGRPVPLDGDGVTTNISRSGIAMSCVRPLKPGDEVRFLLTLPTGKTCEGRGSVIWTKLETVKGVDTPHMGIHIARVDQTYKDYLIWRARHEGVTV